MKPNKIFILTVVVTLLSGCLTEKNESYTTMDNYFKNVTQITTGINGCYNPLRNIFGYRDFWEMTDVAADLMYMNSKNIYNANCDVSPARPGAAVRVWRYGYEGVKNTNDMTYAINRAVENEYITMDEARPLHAEVAVLRAMYYYLLTCTFGDVPYYSERVTEENRERIATLPRMDADATRNYCISEIYELIVEQQALPMVRTYDGTEYRAGAAVGLMLAAKMCMWNERWEDAIMFIEKLEVIYGNYAEKPAKFGEDYRLEDVPFSKSYVKESIFEMANIVEAYGYQTSAKIATSCLPSRQAKSLYEKKEENDGPLLDEDGELTEDTSGWDCYAGICIPELGGYAKTGSTVRPNAYLYTRLLPYDSSDLRNGEYSNGRKEPEGCGALAWRWNGYRPTGTKKVQPYFFYGSSTETKKAMSATSKPWMGNKFWSYGMRNDKDPNNYKIFRFADALLMKAEAYLKTGNPDMACKYLNITRKRANLNEELTFESLRNETANLMEEIRMERAKELVGEFQRKFDLVRWGIWYERTVLYNENTYLQANIRPCHRYWPIPADQVAYSNYALDNKEYTE